MKLFWFASSFVVIFHFTKTTFSEIVHWILYRSKKINNGYIFFSDKTTCAFLCLKKQAECHAYQTNYKDGTNLIGNNNKENCMLYKFSTGITTTGETIIFSPLINTSLSNQQATFLWMKESSLMKIYPHFLMIKSDGLLMW